MQSCNLSCSYCYAGKGEYGNPSRMNLETAKKSVLSFLKRTHHLKIHFFGGEPLLNYPLIKSLILWAEEEELALTYSMTTNGTLLDREKLEFLKTHKVEIKLSYDGRESHRKHRKLKSGKESYSLLETKLKRYQELFKELESVTLRSTFLENEETFIKSFLEEYSGDFEVAYSFVERSQEKSNEERDSFIQSLKKIIMKFMEVCVREGDPKKPLRLLNISSLLERVKKHLPRENFCGAGISYFSISSLGDVYPCHRFNGEEKWILGSVVEEKKIKVQPTLQDTQKIPCESCWVKNLCAGGCHYEHRNHPSKNPFFCDIQKIEVELALYYLKLIRK